MIDYQDFRNDLASGIDNLATWTIKEMPVTICICGGVLSTDENGKITCDLCRLNESKITV